MNIPDTFKYYFPSWMLMSYFFIEKNTLKNKFWILKCHKPKNLCKLNFHPLKNRKFHNFGFDRQKKFNYAPDTEDLR